jgi:uncharacterized membrane protein
MNPLGPILLYTLVIAWTGLAVMPLCRAIFDDVRRVPLFSVSMTVGIPLVLLLFSLFARVNQNYAITIPVTLLLVTLAGLLGWTTVQYHRQPEIDRSVATRSWDRRADVMLLGIFGSILLLMLLLRSTWPGIHWENSLERFGGEKMFNFSMIQAFLFGSGFPPENIWSAGEPLDYYVLLHALPGLVSWAWRILTGDASACSVLFVFSDTFLALFGSFSLTAWSHALLTLLNPSLTRRQITAISLALGVGVLFSVHLDAIHRVMVSWVTGTKLGWWQLEYDVIPYTVTQYPMWLFLKGDHHAFERVFFLQVAFYGSIILLLLADRFKPTRILLSSGLAAAVLLANFGSVLLDLIVLVPAITGMALCYARRREWLILRVHALNLTGVGALALLLSIPMLMTAQTPHVAWYWVESGIASPLLGFLEAQFAPLLFVAAASSAAWVGGSWGMNDVNRLLKGKGILVLAGVAGMFLVAGRSGAAVALSCMLLVLFTAPRRVAKEGQSDRLPLVAIAASIFAIWLFPEFVVSDFSQRPVVEWKRFNVTMRFWLEGYYLIPLLAVLVWAPAFPHALANRTYRRNLAIGAGFVGGLWLVVHGYTVADRISHTPDVPSLDGAEFMAREHPLDAAIIEYLRNAPGRVRLGELCGTGEIVKEVIVEYDWPGRIAAFSGRPSICGWTKHVWQFSNKLRHEKPTGPWTWVRFREYERNMKQAFDAARQRLPSPASRAFFESLSVTHMVVGEGEQKIYPGLTIDELASALGGTVVYRGEGGTGVLSLAAPQLPAQSD